MFKVVIKTVAWVRYVFKNNIKNTGAAYISNSRSAISMMTATLHRKEILVFKVLSQYQPSSQNSIFPK